VSLFPSFPSVEMGRREHASEIFAGLRLSRFYLCLVFALSAFSAVKSCYYRSSRRDFGIREICGRKEIMNHDPEHVSQLPTEPTGMPVGMPLRAGELPRLSIQAVPEAQVMQILEAARLVRQPATSNRGGLPWCATSICGGASWKMASCPASKMTWAIDAPGPRGHRHANAPS